jgi:hypothetical protein
LKEELGENIVIDAMVMETFTHHSLLYINEFFHILGALEVM